MIINRKSRELWIENLPEDNETRIKVVKDEVYSSLSDTIIAVLRHAIYSSDIKISLEEKFFVNEEKLFAIYVSCALSGEEKEGGNFLVRLVTRDDD